MQMLKAVFHWLNEWVVGIFIFLSIAVAVGSAVWSLFDAGSSIVQDFKTDSLRTELQTKGVHTTARVVKSTQTNTYLNEQPEVLARLEVQLPKGETRTVDVRWFVPYLHISKLQTGNTIDVLVDPENAEHVVLVME